MLLALDTETQGTDFNHGALPFYVTITTEDKQILFWEWEVLPSRMIKLPSEDIEEIQAYLDKATRIIGQNEKFDIKALSKVGVRVPWEKIEDTLIAGHLLASHEAHDLTSMVLMYLGVKIEKYEKALEVACNECRRIVKREEKDRTSVLGKYRIADKGLSDMPSARGKCWRADYWLPRTVAKELNYPLTHSYWRVLQEYSNADSYYTLALWEVMEKQLREKGLWAIYRERMKLPPIIYNHMERRGVTQSKERTAEIISVYEAESLHLDEVCTGIAEKEYGYPLNLPTGGRNASLVDFVYGKQGLGLKCSAYTAKGAPSFTKDVLEHLEETLNPDHNAFSFIRSYAQKKKRDTVLGYLEGYRKYWLPIKEHSSYSVLYPSLNQTGAGTLRMSSSNPNGQNLGKKPMPCIRCYGLGCNKCNQLGYDPRTIRYCFGPLPGREWWSLDAINIERRIPAYEAGETEIIALFEHPNDPPYFGSEHGMVAHILWPEEFEACNRDAREFKKKYSSTLYAWVKNGNFATQYGAGRNKANATYHHSGAYDLIKKRFAKQEELNQYWIRFANKHGYVETLPDKLVDPTRGYPIFCQRSIDYSISPTIPLNYHTQSTAMWWMAIAMVAVAGKLDEWNTRKNEGEGYYLIMQIHDEMVFDFPKSKVHPSIDLAKEKETGVESFLSNLWRIRIIQKLMEGCGERIGIPTPVNVEYHSTTWSESITF